MPPNLPHDDRSFRGRRLHALKRKRKLTGQSCQSWNHRHNTRFCVFCDDTCRYFCDNTRRYFSDDIRRTFCADAISQLFKLRNMRETPTEDGQCDLSLRSLISDLLDAKLGSGQQFCPRCRILTLFRASELTRRTHTIQSTNLSTELSIERPQ